MILLYSAIWACTTLLSCWWKQQGNLKRR